MGRLLAGRLGWKFSDLDNCIEMRLGFTVPDIFTLHGEEVFREAEVQELRHLLGISNHVIALGGGAPGTAALRDLLSATPGAVVVHLRAPFAILYERCRKQAMEADSVNRPLLGDQDAAERRYHERLGIYAAVAHHVAEAGLDSPEAVAQGIFQLLSS